MKANYFNYRLDGSAPFQMDYVEAKAFNNPRHLDMHHAVHLGFIIKGDNLARLGGRYFQLNVGDAYLTGRWEAHGSMLSKTGYTIRLITIDPDVLQKHFFNAADRLNQLLTLPAGIRQPLVCSAGLSDYVEHRHEACLAPDADNSDGLLPERQYLAIIDIFIYLLAHLEMPAAAVRTGALFQRLLPAVQLTKRLPERRVSAAEAARACGLSVGRFEHLWRAYFEMGFGRYELENRLMLAVNALSEGRLTVKEVATQWGFSDQNHFARHFKARYQMPPGRYFAHRK